MQSLSRIHTREILRKNASFLVNKLDDAYSDDFSTFLYSFGLMCFVDWTGLAANFKLEFSDSIDLRTLQ